MEYEEYGVQRPSYPEREIRAIFCKTNILKVYHIREKESMSVTSELTFKIKTVPSCPAKILHSYQAGENFGINATGIYEVKTKDNQTFSTTIYPFLQTDYLLGELMGTATEVTEHPEFMPRSQPGRGYFPTI